MRFVVGHLLFISACFPFFQLSVKYVFMCMQYLNVYISFKIDVCVAFNLLKF